MSEPTSCVDVASYIVEKWGPFASSYIHRLLYYCYSWHLVWHDEKLFSEPIEAWANGPIVAAFWNTHYGNFVLAEGMDFLKEKYNLTLVQQASIDAVVNFYTPQYNSQFLAYLSMNEDPWKTAREGLSPTDRGNSLIEDEWIKNYYISVIERPKL